MFYGLKRGSAWRRPSVLWRRRLRSSVLGQIGVICLLWQAGELLARGLRLPIPGAILGLFLMLAALGNGLCSVAALRRGSSWFLAQLLLFLLPAVMSLIDHHEFFGWLGVKVLLAVCLGTLIVMVATALCIDVCHRWMPAQRVPAKAARWHGEAADE